MLIVELWWLAYLQAMGSSETVVAYIFASRGSQSVKAFFRVALNSKCCNTRKKRDSKPLLETALLKNQKMLRAVDVTLAS